jgi:hypothetical protein
MPSSNTSKKMQKVHPQKIIGRKLLHTVTKAKKSFGFEIGIKVSVFLYPLHFCKQFFGSYYLFSQFLNSNEDETAQKRYIKWV